MNYNDKEPQYGFSPLTCGIAATALNVLAFVISFVIAFSAGFSESFNNA